MQCTSCGTNVEAEKYWVRFPCPSCGTNQIIRCEKCKTTENPYQCACGFKGP